MDYQAFIEGERNFLKAPAGYGKTHAIASCLKAASGKQLILTHTHAGVSSIIDKVERERIPSERYSVETISSFTQKYVLAYYTGADFPDQDSKDFHGFLAKKAITIFGSRVTKEVINNTYSGLFVDEYQDCTQDQHAMISAISNYLPTHLLGDPLQGIFNFNNDSVNLDTDLQKFEEFPELIQPHRWYQEGNNRHLGDLIKSMRKNLINGEPLTLSDKSCEGFHFVKVGANDLYGPESTYKKIVRSIISDVKAGVLGPSLLLLVPEYGKAKGQIHERVKIRQQLDPSKSLRLLEAIDDKLFYSLAKAADGILDQLPSVANPEILIRTKFLDKLFNKTELDVWFNDNGLKRKRKGADNKKASALKVAIETFKDGPSAARFRQLILKAKDSLRLKYKREEVLFSLLKALEQADLEQVSVYESMKSGRNVIRRMGRKVSGMCLGTTRLTKGLEFDTVVLLDAHKYDCPKHLYVALSRCCKNLYVFSEKESLNPF